MALREWSIAASVDGEVERCTGLHGVARSSAGDGALRRCTECGGNRVDQHGANLCNERQPVPSSRPLYRGCCAANLPPRMISTNQFKNGTHIEVDGTIFRIMDFQHVKPGKGGAFVRTKLKRVDDGARSTGPSGRARSSGRCGPSRAR